MEIINYSYEEIENICKDISEQIKSSNFKVDYILGVSVGGLFPAVILARLLETKNILSIAMSSYENKQQKEMKLLNAPDKELLKDKNILIVDDICDTGNTIIFLEELLKTYQVNSVKSATIFLNTEHHKITPDYYGEEVDKWVAFPWDQFEKE